MKNILLIILYIISLTGFSQSQLTNFLQAGIEDGETLLSAYFEPYGKGFGSSLNGGWVNTAKTHNTFGFDITFTATVSVIPDVNTTFDISTLNLQKFVLNDPADHIAPTIAGANSNGPLLVLNETNPVTGQPVEISSFNSPKGTGFAFLPLPMVKASFGLPYGIELMGRYAPPVTLLDDYEISLWGVGIKHDIKQYLPFLKRMPVFNISVMAAYTEFISSAKLDLQPFANPVIQTLKTFDNQELGLSANGLTGNLLISANLPVICFYGGIGFNKTLTSLKITGNYPISTIETDPSNQYFGQVVLRDEDVATDPINIDIEANDGLRYMAGIRLKLALVTLHADYTYADYHVASIGLGFTFR